MNKIPMPDCYCVESSCWHFDACAFYRPDTDQSKQGQGFLRHLAKDGYGPGINICLEKCQVPCGDENSRNWTWPGSVIDREPYGVLAHELGHHCDWLTGQKKWSYGSEYCEKVMNEAREKELTGYCPNPAEWFAEMFRLFVTNPPLLKALRPKTYTILLRKWRPLAMGDWRTSLGENVPERVVNSLLKKGAK